MNKYFFLAFLILTPFDCYAMSSTHLPEIEEQELPPLYSNSLLIENPPHINNFNEENYDLLQLITRQEISVSTPKDDNSKKIILRFKKIQSRNTQPAKNYCPVISCDQTFSSCKECKNHWTRDHTLIEKKEKGIVQFDCTQLDCDRTFKTFPEMFRHVCRLHRSQKPFACGVCPKSFSTQSTLNLHITRKHKPKNFICKIAACADAFAVNGDLNQHYRRMHPLFDHRAN